MEPVVLVVLDGWGLSPLRQGNAIAMATTPFMQYAETHFPSFPLDAAGMSVGLLWGEKGNSEVGHMTVGAGRIVKQPFTRITSALEDSTFFANVPLRAACLHARQYSSRLHIVGLYSPGGVHGHMEHMHALLRMAKAEGVSEIHLHLILDGRDVPPREAERSLATLEEVIKAQGVGCIATLMGRFYAMDRNHNWERTELSYKALREGTEITYKSWRDALNNAYRQGVSDEFVVPVALSTPHGAITARISDNDAVIFTNFRADRIVQLTESFVADPFTAFSRSRLNNCFVVSFTRYAKHLPVAGIAFPPQELTVTLGSLVAAAGMHQIRIAESEKEAHVTYFFNGEREEPYAHEDRVMVPSPTVEHFERTPELSGARVTEEVLKALKSKQYQFIVVNYANPDMLAHTGNIPATIHAIEFVDRELAKVWDAVKKKNGTLLITGDHGNAEEMVYPLHGEVNKDHSVNPVPFVVMHNALLTEKSHEAVTALQQRYDPVGILPDVSATVLKFLNIAKPQGFVGQSLV